MLGWREQRRKSRVQCQFRLSALPHQTINLEAGSLLKPLHRTDVINGEIICAEGAPGRQVSGIRPKLHPPGGAFADFRIDGPEAHGVMGLINLYGIESPGLTASLAIADHVAALLQG